MDEMSREESSITFPPQEYRVICWGCGLALILPSDTPIFKCSWCGAITNQNLRKHHSSYLWWRRWRDRCFVLILLIFILFVICGGVWAVYPVVFSVSYFCGVFHSIITILLSVSTISSFSLAAFRCAGTPPSVLWGSYPIVQKGVLEDYTFCSYCSKPKSPRTHHCRTCGMCVLDMDHHCPFIGNCVGAANHRCFIAFLFSAVISTMYLSLLCAYAGLHIWPPLADRSLRHFSGASKDVALRTVKEFIFALLNSAVLFSARGLLLVYLFVASVSVWIGLSVLLWQQLCFIYEGKTYLSQISARESNGVGERSCQNLFRFFGCPYTASRYMAAFFNDKKSHKK